ncbi:MAG: hypothetical protein AB7V56_12035 [Candidatus Nitrosocosmicus sp.]
MPSPFRYRVSKSHAFVPKAFGTGSCESTVFLTIDTYHMNVAFNTISLGYYSKYLN